MVLENAGDFAQTVGKNRRIAGLDVGEKTIGIAVSDTEWMIASPRDTVRRSKFSVDVEVLKNLFASENVGGIVVGLPMNMDGSEGPRCQSIRDFCKNIEAHVDVPLFLWDERLSTVAVTRTLLEADVSRQKRAQVVDKMAASYILQGALERIRKALSTGQ